jgi:hypothetical protein
VEPYEPEQDAGGCTLVAKPTKFGETPAAVSCCVIWLVCLFGEGPMAGLETAWLLLIAVPLGAWTLLMRLRLDTGRLWMTVGPWRRSVDLHRLTSVRWKMTGGGRSRGTIFVTDATRARVPIYVGRYTRLEEWGPLLLTAAASCGALVDEHSRHVLDGSGAGASS